MLTLRREKLQALHTATNKNGKLQDINLLRHRRLIFAFNLPVVELLKDKFNIQSAHPTSVVC